MHHLKVSLMGAKQPLNYQRGLGEVTKDGGNWVEGMEFPLQKLNTL